jgi:hypothetical protein
MCTLNFLLLATIAVTDTFLSCLWQIQHTNKATWHSEPQDPLPTPAVMPVPAVTSPRAELIDDNVKMQMVDFLLSLG